MAQNGARLKDIAEASGFSVNTVSLALRGSSRISEDTQKRVREIAERLNYVPNIVAQSLVSQQTRSVGLVLTDLSNPILTSVAQSIETELSSRNYATLFATSNNRLDEEQRVIDFLRRRRVDGLLVFPCQHHRLDHLRALRDKGMPLVLLVGDPEARLDVVAMNEQAGALKATRYLLAAGHRRVGFIDGGAGLGNREKLAGYEQALAERGLTLDPRLVVDSRGHSAKAGYWGAQAMIESGAAPSAIFATTDSMALGAMRYCAQKGIRVPEDIAIVGFDNIEFAEYARTPITSVAFDVDRISRLAVDRLIELSGAEDSLPAPRATLVDPELILRESSEAIVPGTWPHTPIPAIHTKDTP
ncbi:LacI family DNA-binding transcriptional regulator [Limimaricola sp. AA108-03]|uniref:LacI family DNA-binding transcriptional regulator n=1 Tax=Limimaricola sp. AA108-03 TaxID=3425945 RepID=UPI003D77018E